MTQLALASDSTLAPPAEADYHRKLAPMVLGVLEAYKDDFLVHDKRALSGFQGEFLLGVRSTGTNLLLFGGKTLPTDKMALFEDSPDHRLEDLVNAFLFRANGKFIHGCKGKVRWVNAQRARAIYEQAKRREMKFFA